MNQPQRPLPKPRSTKTGRRLQAESPVSFPAASIDLSAPERAALKIFCDFHVGLGEMFCFNGTVLEKHKASLALLVDKDMVVKEQFTSGYSLTPVGFRAINAAARFGT